MKRNKRSFYQNEPGWLIESFFTAILVFGIQAFGIIFFLLECFRGFPNIAEEPALFISLPAIAVTIPLIMYPEAISRFSWNVHLDEEKVWMKGDRIAAKWYRIQIPVEVKYSEITAISIESSSKNSSGQSIRTWFYGPMWSQKRYLVLKTESGNKKRLHVSHFTDATLAEIIDCIAERCEAAGQKYNGLRADQILFNSDQIN